MRESVSVVQEGDDSDWLAQIESLIQETLQKQGYFQVLQPSTPYLIRAEAHERHYVVNVEIDGGPRYRLDEIHLLAGRFLRKRNRGPNFRSIMGTYLTCPNSGKAWNRWQAYTAGWGFIDMVPWPKINIDVKNLQSMCSLK